MPKGQELLTTTQAARQLGISSRTLVRYAEKGYVKPALVLPSGHRRWKLADVRRQIMGMPQDDAE